MSQRPGLHVPCRATGETPGFGQEAEDGHQPLLGFLQEIKTEQGRQLRMASWNDSGGLWGIEVVFSFLIPGPRLI